MVHANSSFMMHNILQSCDKGNSSRFSSPGPEYSNNLYSSDSNYHDWRKDKYHAHYYGHSNASSESYFHKSRIIPYYYPYNSANVAYVGEFNGNIPTAGYASYHNYDQFYSKQQRNNPFADDCYLAGSNNSNFSLLDANNKRKRTRTIFTKEQILQLEKAYASNRYLTGVARTEIARKLQMSTCQVKIWFQNKRNKEKKEKSLHCEESDFDDSREANSVEHESFTSGETE